ncbi:MAG: 30S ribosomal protein S9 [Planctomycetota bacterium]|jgi:small subunit ribosomal protein S9
MEENVKPEEADAAVLTLGSAAAEVAEGEEGAEEEPQIDPLGRLIEVDANAYHWGTGRRKNSVARVRVRPGSGQFIINGKAIADYFPRGLDQSACNAPLKSLEVQKKVDVFVNTHGGGNTGQAGAVRMGLSRALLGLYPDAHRVLAEGGHFTRDPRMVERKKYGRHGARRGHQWGKR